MPYHPRRVALATLFLASACTSPAARQALVSLGFEDPGVPPPEHLAILCDASAGSSCSYDTLGQVLAASLEELTRRPGSRVSLYMLGNTAAETRLVHRDTVGAPPSVGQREIAAFREREAARLMDAFLSAAGPALRDVPTSSPLIESITKLAALERFDRLIIVSDGLEESAFGDWECGPLPDTSELDDRLEEAGLLLPTTLPASVTFAFRRLDPIDHGRCALSLARAQWIAFLWRVALVSAGARSVAFTAGAPAPDSATAPQASGGAS